MQYDDTLSLSNTLRYLTHDVRSGGPGATANLYDKRHSKALSFLNVQSIDPLGLLMYTLLHIEAQREGRACSLLRSALRILQTTIRDANQERSIPTTRPNRTRN